MTAKDPQKFQEPTSKSAEDAPGSCAADATNSDQYKAQASKAGNHRVNSMVVTVAGSEGRCPRATDAAVLRPSESPIRQRDLNPWSGCSSHLKAMMNKTLADRAAKIDNEAPVRKNWCIGTCPKTDVVIMRCVRPKIGKTNNPPGLLTRKVTVPEPPIQLLGTQSGRRVRVKWRHPSTAGRAGPQQPPRRWEQQPAEETPITS